MHCSLFQSKKDLNKAASGAVLPLFVMDDDYIYVVCNKTTWHMNLSHSQWTRAVHLWISTLYTFWLEAPPQLDFFKICLMKFVLKHDITDMEISPAQSKVMESFKLFCAS